MYSWFCNQKHLPFGFLRYIYLHYLSKKSINLERMGLGLYDLGDGEFAAAVAASAFAVHSIDEYQRRSTEGSEIAGLSRSRTRKDERSLPIESSAALGRSFGQRQKTTSFSKPMRFTENHQQHRNSGSKVDSWERSEMEKIKKRYEKMQYDILAWGNVKKTRAKLQMENKKKDLEVRRERNFQHYKSKLAKIDLIVGGARTQMDDKRSYEETMVKERARKFRSKGYVPVSCFCF